MGSTPVPPAIAIEKRSVVGVTVAIRARQRGLRHPHQDGHQGEGGEAPARPGGGQTHAGIAIRRSEDAPLRGAGQPDAWVDVSRTKIGYEIPLNRHVHVYEPPRPLEKIESELKALEREIAGLLSDVVRS